ncbi:MAG TPA: hypothetical protein VF970_13355 [Gemmatimonadales bacterium]
MFTTARTRPAAGRFVILCALLAGAGCSDPIHDLGGPPPPPSSGSLSVSTITTGGEFDLNGYLISVSGGEGVLTELNATRGFYDLTPGDLGVELMDIAPNCSASGDTQQVVTITAGVAAAVRFELTCTPRPELADLRLLFARAGDHTQIYAMNGDGTGLTQLTSGPSENFSPALSPDGTKVAFVSDRDGVLVTFNDPFDEVGEYREGRDVYVMNADGTGTVRLTFGGDNYDPAWSPDGTRIAFAWPGGIWVIGADGSNDVDLTYGPGDFAPAWSPDGGRIAFTRAEPHPYVLGAIDTAKIWLVNVDGGGLTRLTDFQSSGPIWSPDGGKIAFTGFRPAEPGGQVYVMNSDGSGVVRLTSGDLAWEAGAYSPDGRQITLIGTRSLEGEIGLNAYSIRSIYVMNAEGGGIARMTAGSWAYESSPTLWPRPTAAGIRP